MDIQSLSISLAQSKVADAVGSAMLKKSLSDMGDAGAALAQLFESVASPPASAPLPSGSGTKIDLSA
ncbi:MAG: YjfB family protein [Rectinemataceae bacterium]